MRFVVARVGAFGFALGLILAASGCVPAPAAPAASGAPKELQKVRFGYTKQLSDAPLFRIPEKAKALGYDVQFVEQRLYPDLLKGLALGEADISTMGYTQAAPALEQKFSNVKFISGFVTGGTSLVMNKDKKVTVWKDVEGKTIGVFAGGPGELSFRTGLATHGVDLTKVNVVKLTVPGAPTYQALQKGEIDGYVGWEPFAATSVIDGYAYRAPFDISADESKGVNVAIAANTDWLAKNGDTAVALLKLIDEEVKTLKANEGEWRQLAQETLGLKPEVFDDAIRNFSLDTDLPFKMKEAQAQAKEMAQYGMTQSDLSAQIPTEVDYSYLEKATGKTKQQLGGS